MVHHDAVILNYLMLHIIGISPGSGMCNLLSELYNSVWITVQYSHREIPISPARLGDTFCCLGDFLSFHRDNRYSQRDAQVTQRDVVTVHRA